IFPFPFKEIDLSRANKYILEAYKKNQELFIPFFLMSEGLTPKHLENSNIYGVKEHFYVTGDLDKRVFFNIYDYLEQNGLFLLIHSKLNTIVHNISLIKNNFPGLKIILAHSGRKWPFTGDDVMETVIPELKNYKELYFETSTIRDSGVITAMVNQIGSQRILFGSDYPFSKQGEDIYLTELAIVDEASISDEDKINILCSNFKNLFLKDVWIRRVKKEDKDNIFELIKRLSKEEIKFLALDKKFDVIKANIRSERHIYLLENQDKIIGYLRESGRNNNGAIIEEILIDSAYRGKGYAEFLVRAIENKFSYIEQKTFSKNITVNKLNQKLGYIIVKKSNSGQIYYWRKDNANN
ncbi:MAG: GNAT family N-acetyltransferase, partial [Firmicutes bacterium]|nr:GNAT family N-acetyltransferase [Bacillota bacterium]